MTCLTTGRKESPGSNIAHVAKRETTGILYTVNLTHAPRDLNSFVMLGEKIRNLSTNSQIPLFA
jgi:hypothetical protein